MKVARAEIKLTAFMCKHRTPFKQADDLTPLLMATFSDSEIAKELKMKKTKASYVIQDGIAQQEKLCICKALKNKI